MKEDKIQEMLGADYEIRLSGGMIGYLLKLLADRQHELNGSLKEDSFDPMKAILAATNDVVGNSLLHEAYESCGAAFLAFCMSTSEEDMKRLMESKDKESVEKAAKAIKRSQDKTLN